MNVLIAGEGPEVLLVHGFPDTHTVWRKQVAALFAASYRVIAPDTRGCSAGSSQIRVLLAPVFRRRQAAPGFESGGE